MEFYWKEENKEDSTNGNIYFIYVQNIAIWKYLLVKIDELKCNKKKTFNERILLLEIAWNRVFLE